MVGLQLRTLRGLTEGAPFVIPFTFLSAFVRGSVYSRGIPSLISRYVPSAM